MLRYNSIDLQSGCCLSACSLNKTEVMNIFQMIYVGAVYFYIRYTRLLREISYKVVVPILWLFFIIPANRRRIERIYGMPIMEFIDKTKHDFRASDECSITEISMNRASILIFLSLIFILLSITILIKLAFINSIGTTLLNGNNLLVILIVIFVIAFGIACLFERKYGNEKNLNMIKSKARPVQNKLIYIFFTYCVFVILIFISSYRLLKLMR